MSTVHPAILNMLAAQALNTKAPYVRVNRIWLLQMIAALTPRRSRKPFWIAFAEES